MRTAVGLIALAASLGCGAGNSKADANPPAPGGTAVITVEMHGFRSDRGSALVGLYADAEGFPNDGGAAFKRVEVTISGGTATATFSAVPATTVAVGVLHDEDGDKVMKTGFMGRPKEGYGVTRDAPARFGPPSFEDSSIVVTDGQRLTTRIKIRY